MKTKPKTKKNLTISNTVITALKKRYFDVAAKENYPGTPALTAELDNLEVAIREMIKK